MEYPFSRFRKLGEGLYIDKFDGALHVERSEVCHAIGIADDLTDDEWTEILQSLLAIWYPDRPSIPIQHVVDDVLDPERN